MSQKRAPSRQRLTHRVHTFRGDCGSPPGTPDRKGTAASRPRLANSPWSLHQDLPAASQRVSQESGQELETGRTNSVACDTFRMLSAHCGVDACSISWHGAAGSWRRHCRVPGPWGSGSGQSRHHSRNSRPTISIPPLGAISCPSWTRSLFGGPRHKSCQRGRAPPALLTPHASARFGYPVGASHTACPYVRGSVGAQNGQEKRPDRLKSGRDGGDGASRETGIRG